MERLDFAMTDNDGYFSIDVKTSDVLCTISAPTEESALGLLRIASEM